MKRLFAALFALSLLFWGCSDKAPVALPPEEFMAYSEEGDAISPLSTKGEFTLTKNGVTTGSAGTADPAYSFRAYHSKRGIALGSTLWDLAAAYPELSFSVIYGQSEDFKVETDVSPKKIASQAQAGKDIAFVLYTVRSIGGEALSAKEFNEFCEKNSVDSVTLSTDPGKYGYECWGMIFGVSGETVDSISFTATAQTPAEPKSSASIPPSSAPERQDANQAGTEN